MPWVKVDDHIDENPKTAQLDNDAFALYICGLAYCNRNLTDGFIPTHVGRGKLRYCEHGTAAPITQLESLGFWEPCPGGWKVHDYSDYQPSREQVESERETTRQRVQSFRQNKRNSVTHTVTTAVSNAVSTDGVTPDVHGNPESRVPNPESSTEKSKTKAGASASRFSPPTPDEVEQEFERKGFGGLNLGVRFVAHYQTAGWKVKGGNKMTDWKAAVVTWCERQKERMNGNGGMTLQESAAVELERIKRLGI